MTERKIEDKITLRLKKKLKLKENFPAIMSEWEDKKQSFETSPIGPYPVQPNWGHIEGGKSLVAELRAQDASTDLLQVKMWVVTGYPFDST